MPSPSGDFLFRKFLMSGPTLSFLAGVYPSNIAGGNASADWLSGINDGTYFYNNGHTNDSTLYDYGAQNIIAVSSNTAIAVGTIGRGAKQDICLSDAFLGEGKPSPRPPPKSAARQTGV